ncbi:MAG: peptide chain release factor 2 [Patescibacteria group bacterium]
MDQTWQLIHEDQLEARESEVEGLMAAPDFWSNQQRASALGREASEIKQELDTWKQIKQEVQEAIDYAELAEQEPEETKIEIRETLRKKLQTLEDRFSDLEFTVLLGETHDTSNAIVAVHAGAGGVDAQDWAEMLLRMLLRFCEKKGWEVKMIDTSRGGEAGIKSAMFEVHGRYAYGYLKSEHGVHRLVRQSPFNADALRQTSFALVEILPELSEAAQQEIEIPEKDLRIDVFRAGGKGGQGVNTTDSAVRIVHLPSKITVVCQNERSQLQNKATAMKVLRSKLAQKQMEELEREKAVLRGEFQSAEWGNQIRSYVLHPYKMVKDHRTNYEVSDPDAVLDGNVEGFMEAYLRARRS